MKIVVDENISQADYFFADFGEVVKVNGRTLTQQQLQDVDVLLVRSVTTVNAALLEGTPVRFVGSATIGTDHVDLNYLKQNNIAFAHAPGCNAQAVAEYVTSAILTINDDSYMMGIDFTVGIVGFGNVGRRLARIAQLMGWNVLVNDPFKTPDIGKAVDLAHLVQHSDVVSLHVPYTTDGAFPTRHLIDANLFHQMPSETLLINTSRGAVVKEDDLIWDMEDSKRQVVLDVFEHEPNISQQLLDYLTAATPHIAGYSVEGKLKGTQQIYEAFCQWQQISPNKQWQSVAPACTPIFSQKGKFNVKVAEGFEQAYDIYADDLSMRQLANYKGIQAEQFDFLRKHYPLRREWQSLGLSFDN